MLKTRIRNREPEQIDPLATLLGQEAGNGQPSDIEHVPGEDQPTVAGPPAVGFDLLGGHGRRAYKTRLLNRRLVVAAITLFALVAALVGKSYYDRASASDELAALASQIDQLNRELVAATDSVLPEADLAAHVAQRRTVGFDTAASELPYRQVFASLLTVAANVDVTVTGIEFRGADIDNGVTISGTAPDLATLGAWNEELQARYSLAVPGGFIEHLATTYRTLEGADTEAFTTTMRVSVDQLQTQVACARLAAHLDQQIEQCDGVADLDPVALPPAPVTPEPEPDTDAFEEGDQDSPLEPLPSDEDGNDATLFGPQDTGSDDTDPDGGDA